MTTSLLWSALLMATFLGPVNGDANTTPTSVTSQQPEQQPASTLNPSFTVSTEVVQSSTKLITTKVTTPALSTASTAKPSTCSPLPNCDCLQDITEGKDTIALLAFGGLTLGCLILLITTMTLACKLCHIQRHYRDYQICHVDASPANGRAKAEELNDSSILMSEVSKDERTARDSAENNQSKEKKEKEEEKEKANGGSAQSSVDEAGTAKSDETAAPDNSDANEGTANKAKQPESSGEETTKTPAATATTTDTDTDNKAEDEADGAKSVEEETKTEAATAEKSTTEA
ncbi:uncharacterized protein LOC134080757 [Sardina pilchardus]|uniref:uncharacterized protein LOC134080757 n=1 Tax=Sardina pilchardus TaxID=27697 RepID=UPI002E1087A1